MVNQIECSLNYQSVVKQSRTEVSIVCILTIKLSCLFNIQNDICTVTSHLHLGINSPPARFTMIRNNLKAESRLMLS